MRRKKMNNKGNTLIIVLVMTAFMMILGTVAVTAAMLGYKMKLVDKEVKRTFYSAEEVVDEIYAGLGMSSMEMLKNSYEGVLSKIQTTATFTDENNKDENGNTQSYQYSLNITNEQANNLLRREFSANMLNLIADTGKKESDIALVENELVIDSTNYSRFLDYVNKHYIESPKLAQAVSVDKIYLTKKNQVIQNGESSVVMPQYVINMKNLTVEYRTNEIDESDTEQTYYSRVTFDVVLGLDEVVNFSAYSASILAAFEDYTLIGCKGVTLTDGNVSMSSTGIYGGVASTTTTNEHGLTADNTANGGIFMHNATVSITSAPNYLVSKGQLTLNKSTVSGDEATTDVWCVDMITQDEGSKINLSGAIHVYDDTEINGDNNEITLAGTYLGFGDQGYGYNSQGTQISQAHLNSSAIVVNGLNSKLNMEKINKLVLGGRAYIDYNSIADPYRMGQSVALKGDQEVYLVPETYLSQVVRETDIDGITRELPKGVYNPVAINKRITWTGRTADIYAGTGNVEEFPVIINLSADNFFGYQYLNPTEPFRIVTKEYRNYIYLNFIDQFNVDHSLEYFNAIFAETEVADNLKTSRDYMRSLIHRNLVELKQESVITGANSGTTTFNINGALINAATAESTAADMATMSAYDLGKFTAIKNDMSNRYTLIYKTLVTLPEQLQYITFPTEAVVGSQKVSFADVKDNTTPYSYYINEEAVSKYIANGGTSTLGYRNEMLNGNRIYVSQNSNETYTVEGTSGVIVTKGNVILKNDFNGLILAEGKITLQGNASLDNSKTSGILDNNKDLRDCFNLASTRAGSGAGESQFQAFNSNLLNVKYQDMLTFENWRKQSPKVKASND